MKTKNNFNLNNFDSQFVWVSRLISFGIVCVFSIIMFIFVYQVYGNYHWKGTDHWCDWCETLVVAETARNYKGNWLCRKHYAQATVTENIGHASLPR